MKPRKQFKDLNFSDSFLFTATMEEESTCKAVLECILGFPIKKVVVHTEHFLTVSPDHHGIRMDVYADDEDGTAFDIEMQTTNKGDLPKRSRFYQGQLDLLNLQPGDSYNKLRNSYIIFLCTFDPFGRGLYRYTFEERCRECDMPLGDGTRKVFLNTKGKNDAEVSAGLVKLLKFVENSERPVSLEAQPQGSEDPLIVHLQKRIWEIKKNRRMEERYMSFEEMLQDERMEGREEGVSQISALMKAMLLDSRTQEDIMRVLEDRDLLEEMLAHYKIE